MDIYALTRKKRPSHLTLGQPASFSSSVGHENNKSESVPTTPVEVIVTGPPRRDHWKPDSESDICGYPGCSVSFGLFERRHHCRRCGDLFCSIHCSNYFRLDQNSQFHTRGHLSRGCNNCVNEYHQMQEKKDEPLQQTKTLSRRPGFLTPQPQSMEGVMELGRDDIVQAPDPKSIGPPANQRHQGFIDPISTSVPADWHWSTF